MLYALPQAKRSGGYKAKQSQVVVHEDRKAKCHLRLGYLGCSYQGMLEKVIPFVSRGRGGVRDRTLTHLPEHSVRDLLPKGSPDLGWDNLTSLRGGKGEGEGGILKFPS